MCSYIDPCMCQPRAITPKIMNAEIADTGRNIIVYAYNVKL